MSALSVPRGDVDANANANANADSADSDADSDSDSAAGLSVIVEALAVEGVGNRSVRLVSANGQPLPSFGAGAHVDVEFPGGLIRQYSIASSPECADHYLLCVRLDTLSRGGSSHVHARLAVGDRLRISAPRNAFALVDADDYLLVAGGIGITPLRSMAESLDARAKPFELHYYVRTRAEVAFADRLATGYAHGTVQVHCSAEGQSARQVLPASLAAPAAGRRLYLCGPQGFMDHVVAAATQRGWTPSNIHREAFAPVAPEVVAGDRAFDVTLASDGRTFTVPADRTIAAVLCEAGVAVSLSCEMGLCGACLTRVIDGIPDHRDTVQSDGEKAAAEQYITVCCSRSLTASLTIDL